MHAATADADEEDAALSAFDSFCAGVQKGRFPQLADRDDLWRLLVTITGRKALDQAERQRRQKRGAVACGTRPTWRVAVATARQFGFEQFIGEEPTPEFAALVVEEYRNRLEVLEDDTLRRIATWKLEGYTNEEIADRLGCALRTVANKLKLIRLKWEQDVMVRADSRVDGDPTVADFERILQVCDGFEAQWRLGERPRIEELLATESVSTTIGPSPRASGLGA